MRSVAMVNRYRYSALLNRSVAGGAGSMSTRVVEDRRGPQSRFNGATLASVAQVVPAVLPALPRPRAARSLLTPGGGGAASSAAAPRTSPGGRCGFGGRCGMSDTLLELTRGERTRSLAAGPAPCSAHRARSSAPRREAGGAPPAADIASSRPPNPQGCTRISSGSSVVS